LHVKKYGGRSYGAKNGRGSDNRQRSKRGPKQPKKRTLFRWNKRTLETPPRETSMVMLAKGRGM